MKILTAWLRSYLPPFSVSDAELGEALTLRGIAVEGITPIASGSVFEMDITTNRVDAMNHYGVAREAGAIYGLPLASIASGLSSSGMSSFSGGNESTSASLPQVRIEAPDGCGRFTARVLRDVTIRASEGRTDAYFRALGMRAISNAVDASNFVLHAMGQPTHAFDLDRLAGAIIVRRARAGEQLRLLDGTTRTLDAEDLVIADERQALSLAGVMGGFDSMITESTRNILIESAWFDPATVRASARRHGLHTDASHRFERGADFAAAPVGNALVAHEILSSAGGRLQGDLIDLVVPGAAARTAGRPPVELSVARVRHLLGETLDPAGFTPELVAATLRGLGCELDLLDPDRFAVHLPTWRLDLARPVDLVEEVARVYGYNRLRNTLPAPLAVRAHPLTAPTNAVRSRLLALGWTEALSFTFASAPDSRHITPAHTPVPLENPLNEEAAVLRTALVPGMLDMLAHNIHRDVTAVQLFETGAVFAGAPGKAVYERTSLCLGLTGPVAATPLVAAADAPFFLLKGAVEAVLRLFVTDTLTWSGKGLPGWLAPGRAATVRLGTGEIAVLGQLAEHEGTRRKLRQPVYLALIDLAALFALPLRQPVAKEISRFGAVERDLSLLFPDSVSWSTVSDAIRALPLAELRTIEPVEIFRERTPGHFSLLLRLRFQSNERTLTESDLSLWSGEILRVLEAAGGVLRG